MRTSAVVLLSMLYLFVQAACRGGRCIDLWLVPVWNDIDLANGIDEVFGVSLVEVGEIRLRNRSGTPIHLDKIEVAWNGQPLEMLAGSIYRSDNMGHFSPTDRFLVCDGEWSERRQALIFRMPNSQHVDSDTVYHLAMVTFPGLVLNGGYFTVNCVPLLWGIELHKNRVTHRSIVCAN